MSQAEPVDAPSRAAARGERFTVATAAIVRRLPFGLAALGLDYRIARIVAGACEALYMYAAMRWLVFRDVQRPALIDRLPR